MSDLISRKDAIEALWEALYEYEDKTEKQFIESDELDVEDWVQHRIFVQNMNDIDRQTILDLSSAQPNNECEKCVFYPFKQFRQTAQLEQRWIPCSERLPKKGLRVLMYLNNAWQIVGWYDKEDKQWYALPFGQEVFNGCVLAWMPLPEDYEESEEKE